MADRLSIERFLEQAAHAPVLDVRTPSEFRHGHIPGAANLPLFSEEDRAEIGTLYKQRGREDAMLLGLDRVGPKMRFLVESAGEHVAGGPLLLHCWRGGMRSEAVGWLLSFFGMEVATLQGGYKAFRRYALGMLEEPRQLFVVGGLTGSGKTAILHALQQAGEQVIDLEALACHRGSVFGHLGMDDQPTQEQFENDLAMAWRKMDPGRPVWIEDESRRIGRVVLPGTLYERKSAAPTALIVRPSEERIERLVTEYGPWGVDRLVEAVRSIQKRLGGARTRDVTSMIVAGNLAGACGILLDYYDAAYSHALERRGVDAVQAMLPPDCSARDAADTLIQTMYARSI